MAHYDRLELTLEDFLTFEINLKKKNNQDPIQALPGWYYFMTNTPGNKFLQFAEPPHKANYNLANRAEKNLILVKENIAINPTGEYICYMGHAADLKGRIRNHINGAKGTGCLSLRSYKPLKKFDWKVAICYQKELYRDDLSKESLAQLRKFHEKEFVINYGWPILCDD